jgi:hypothetical protein
MHPWPSAKRANSSSSARLSLPVLESTTMLLCGLELLPGLNSRIVRWPKSHPLTTTPCATSGPDAFKIFACSAGGSAIDQVSAAAISSRVPGSDASLSPPDVVSLRLISGCCGGKGQQLELLPCPTRSSGQRQCAGAISAALCGRSEHLQGTFAWA